MTDCIVSPASSAGRADGVVADLVEAPALALLAAVRSVLTFSLALQAVAHTANTPTHIGTVFILVLLIARCVQ